MEFLYIRANWMDAEEALGLGVLNRLVPAKDLEKETMALAQRIAEGPQIALRLIKEQVHKGLEVSFDMSLAIAADGEAMAVQTEDYQGAKIAFNEKRQPIFPRKVN
jgi:enoyl-CoA hydratase/carnithine racemase